LPFTEDHALAETLRIKRPRQECFNCLSTNHRVSECPVKVDQERIEIHRKLYNSQAQQAQEQAQLFSNRYTSDTSDSKSNRGFTPGKFSEQLREALGIKENQLPPFIYLMRKLGYPKGWLIEAQIKSTKLAVHDDSIDTKKKYESIEDQDIVEVDDESKSKQKEKENEVEISNFLF
jgi:zinc finger CCHC domain-containing protein 8